MIASAYKMALKARKPLITAMVRFQSPVFASVIAKSGVDAITIDDETINNNTVTLRNRDTMEQITLNVNEVASYINEKIKF